MENISWADCVGSNVVLCRIEEERNILHNVKGRKDQWFGHTLRKNCVLKPIIEGRMEVTGRGGRRRQRLLGDLKATRGYWILKEEGLDRTFCRNGLGSGGVAVVSQTTGAGFCSARI